MKAKKSLGWRDEMKWGLLRGVSAKWGQHFLRDPKILKKIVDFAEINKADIVVEIGPGEGTLTEFLLTKAKKVIAIEKDKFLAKQLENKFYKHIEDGGLQVVKMDILKSRVLSFESPYVLVGNIPYYITGALFKKFLESKNPPSSITFVVQKEVAERIVARSFNSAGTSQNRRKESILSISVKVYGEPKYGGMIKAGSFYPKPKVDSAIISVRNISKSNFVLLSEKKFFGVLKAGFAHKRKFLINNLGKMRENAFCVFEKCGISKKARAEDLEINDWLCLTKYLM